MESLNHPYWFEDGFDQSIKTIILESWSEKYTTRCQEESRRWAKYLLESDPDLDVEIHEGFYYVSGDENRAEGHTWVIVDSSIFDPTASQFKEIPDFNNYHPHRKTPPFRAGI